MILITLLFVLAMERSLDKTPHWHIATYSRQYLDFLAAKGWLDEAGEPKGLLPALLLPVLLLLVVQVSIDSGLLLFILYLASLYICIGCPAYREAYKGFLSAVEREDDTACMHYEQQLEHDASLPGTLGRTLVWLNYRYYAAVIIWFVLLGPAGALLYTLAREFQHQFHHPQASPLLDKCLFILDWIPSRVVSMGFMLVGDFSRAFGVWTDKVVHWDSDAKQTLVAVAGAADDSEPCEVDKGKEPAALLALAKRNILLLTVVIGILSLAGWLG